MLLILHAALTAGKNAHLCPSAKTDEPSCLPEKLNSNKSLKL